MQQMLNSIEGTISGYKKKPLNSSKCLLYLINFSGAYVRIK